MTRFDSIARQVAWLRPVLALVLACLLVTTLSRVILVLWQWDRVHAVNGLIVILGQGLRFDLVTLGWLIGIPVAITPLMLSIRRIGPSWLAAFHLYGLLILGALLFMELATPSFVAQFDIRPNLLFVDYLRYPKEVVSMLWAAYSLPICLALVLLPATIYVAHRFLARARIGVVGPSLPVAILCVPLLLVLAVASVRSTLDHRPVNPSTVAFSNDPLINTLALNSTYTVAYALYELRYEELRFAYGDVDQAQVIDAVRSAMALSPDAFESDDIPTLHFQQATRHYARPKNLVVIIEESLGAEFVGRMGGPPLTPNLDRLADQGIWFENLYATGTRSVRGLEAIISGFWPSTSKSVVKLGKSQRNFFTLGQALKEEGYATSFIYGGEAQFDNMGRFFANNGFDQIVEKRDYVDPVFLGSWGVSDEDLFNMAAKRFAAQPKDQPFFSLIFTSSNHSPYEFPDGRIQLHEQPATTVNNAVKYADHALGQFMHTAMDSDYWDDTVFLIVADHNSRVYGAQLVPVERFHIPAVILGGSIEPQRIKRIASQVDLLPTLLSLIGVSTSHPAIGLDLTRPDIDQIPGRAVMQYGSNHGYLEGNQLVVLRRDLPPAQFLCEDGALTQVDTDTHLLRRVLQLAAWPGVAYGQRRYRLPTQPPRTALLADTAL